jgi:hypothetical protein
VCPVQNTQQQVLASTICFTARFYSYRDGREKASKPPRSFIRPFLRFVMSFDHATVRLHRNFRSRGRKCTLRTKTCSHEQTIPGSKVIYVYMLSAGCTEAVLTAGGWQNTSSDLKLAATCLPLIHPSSHCAPTNNTERTLSW